MPGHFQPTANAKYGYMPRKGDLEGPTLTKTRKLKNEERTYTVANWHYSWRKRKVKKHNRPLVFTGNSERAANQLIRIKFRGSGKKRVLGIGVLPLLPKYFYQYTKRIDGTPGPNKFAELTRTTPDENSQLLGVIRTSIPGELKKQPRRTRVEK